MNGKKGAWRGAVREMSDAGCPARIMPADAISTGWKTRPVSFHSMETSSFRLSFSEEATCFKSVGNTAGMGLAYRGATAFSRMRRGCGTIIPVRSSAAARKCNPEPSI